MQPKGVMISEHKKWGWLYLQHRKCYLFSLCLENESLLDKVNNVVFLGVLQGLHKVLMLACSKIVLSLCSAGRGQIMQRHAVLYIIT